MHNSKVVLQMQMHKEARHSHGGSNESMSLFSAMLASRYGRCMEMKMRSPALWLLSKHSPPLCMIKGTPCSLSGTSAASSGHVLHTPCTAVKHWLVALVSVLTTISCVNGVLRCYPILKRWHYHHAMHIMYCTETVVSLSVPQCLPAEAVKGDKPLAHCTHGLFGPMDNTF